MKQTTLILCIVVLLLAAGAGGWLYLSRRTAGEIHPVSKPVAAQNVGSLPTGTTEGSAGSRMKGQPKLKTALVTRGDIVEEVHAKGKLNPVIYATVGCAVPGTIQMLYAGGNSLVKENEPLAEIDPTQYIAALHSAQANMAYAQAALELAQVTVTRKTRLVTEHAAASADLDTAIANLHESQATLQISQANAETAQNNLNHCAVLSPVSGIVISCDAYQGETVSPGSPMFTIANDLSKMQIDTEVAESDIGQLKAGQPADFTVAAYPDHEFHGVVKQVSNAPITVDARVCYDVVVAVENGDQFWSDNNNRQELKPGMTAYISVKLTQKKNVLRVRNDALQFGANDNAERPKVRWGQNAACKVRIARSDMPKFTLQDVEVRVGMTDGVYSEVLDGLTEGEAVVCER
jgi:HlyD family secretion protein